MKHSTRKKLRAIKYIAKRSDKYISRRKARKIAQAFNLNISISTRYIKGYKLAQKLSQRRCAKNPTMGGDMSEHELAYRHVQFLLEPNM